MDVEELLELYKNNLNNKETTTAQKLRSIKKLLHFLQENYDLNTSNICFNEIIPLSYDKTVFKLPINETVIQDFLSKECKDMGDHSYNTIIAHLKDFMKIFFFIQKKVALSLQKK